MSDDIQYKTLMEYLRRLHREKAEFVGWIPNYERKNVKPTGKVTITIEVKENNV